jgi:hypothetical protein
LVAKSASALHATARNLPDRIRIVPSRENAIIRCGGQCAREGAKRSVLPWIDAMKRGGLSHPR